MEALYATTNTLPTDVGVVDHFCSTFQQKDLDNLQFSAWLVNPRFLKCKGASQEHAFGKTVEEQEKGYEGFHFSMC